MQKINKFLVYVCRHGAHDCGLETDPDGWVDIDEVLRLRPARMLTSGHVRQVVGRAAGGRLEVNERGTAIRAIQVHSLHIRDDNFRRATWDDEVPGWLIRGTDDASWLKIKDEGIKPMGRQHVHLAQDLAVVHDYSTVHIYIDKAAVMNHGLELLIARSSVILCRGTIPPDCFYSAWHVTQERDLLRLGDRDWVVAEEVETTTRWKQIRLGEWTHEFSVWMYSSDADKKLFPTKQPPDSSADMPKRRFLKELSAWRRSLHEFHEWLSNKHRRNPEAPASSYRNRTSYVPSAAQLSPAKRPRSS